MCGVDGVVWALVAGRGPLWGLFFFTSHWGIKATPTTMPRERKCEILKSWKHFRVLNKFYFFYINVRRRWRGLSVSGRQRASVRFIFPHTAGDKEPFEKPHIPLRHKGHADRHATRAIWVCRRHERSISSVIQFLISHISFAFYFSL